MTTTKCGTSQGIALFAGDAALSSSQRPTYATWKHVNAMGTHGLVAGRLEDQQR